MIVHRAIPVVASQMSDDPEGSPYYAPFTNLPESFSGDDKARLREEGLKAVRDSVLPAFADLNAFFVKDMFTYTLKYSS